MIGLDCQLTLSSLTLGQTPFEERVRVAASAGFDGIGLSAEVYAAALRSGLDDRTMQSVLDDHGVAVTEVEFLSDWLQSGGPGRKEATVFHIARTFAADHVNVGLFDPGSPELMKVGFAALCQRAGDVKVALEFMPFGGIPDLSTAFQMVGFAGRPNAGLVIDVWHWVRAGTGARDLAGAADRVFVVQLCDVARVAMPDLRHESRHHRLVPGDGDGHANALVALLIDQGIRPQLSVEVMSDALLAKGNEATAEAVIAGARRVLANHRWLTADGAG